MTKIGGSVKLSASGEKWGIVMREPNFIGRHFYSIDAKNRLAIPAKMRTAIPARSSLILSRGLEDCLYLYPPESWGKLHDKLEALPMKDKKDQRAFKRILFASAGEVEFDEEGRILIPQHLVEYARLKKEVAVLGMGDKIEIWAKQLWLAYEKKQGGIFARHASNLQI